jgi:hypothetical protein
MIALFGSKRVKHPQSMSSPSSTLKQKKLLWAATTGVELPPSQPLLTVGSRTVHDMLL